MSIAKDFSLKFIKYSGVGIISTTLYFLSVFILVEIIHLRPVFSSAISFILMTFASFHLNKVFTFGGDFTKKKLVRFYTISTVGFILNYIIMYTIVHEFNYHYIVGELVTVLTIPIINFTLNYFWTFK